MSVLFLYPYKLYKKLLALSLYVGIKTNNIDILFFTWPVMGKQKNTVQFNVPGLFGCSGVFRCSEVFQCSNVPVFQCSSVPVFQCSSVPVFQCFSTCQLDPEPRSQRVIQNFRSLFSPYPARSVPTPSSSVRNNSYRPPQPKKPKKTGFFFE